MEEKRLIEEAKLLRSRGEYRESGRVLKAAAELGSVEALYLLGENLMDEFRARRVTICSTYEVIKADVEERQLACFRECAERGYAPAMLRLGDLYRDGSSCVNADRNRAVHWYQRAMRMGEAEAAVRLADPELSKKPKGS